MATLIELGHRVTSGLALLLVIGLVVGAWRRFPPRPSRATVGGRRRSCSWSLEALIGAGLVLLELVADDALDGACLVDGRTPGEHLPAGRCADADRVVGDARRAAAPARRRRARARRSGVALAGMLVLGVSGAITALGDTLFPAASLAEGKAQTFSDSAHVFVRLRVWHPSWRCTGGSAGRWRRRCTRCAAGATPSVRAGGGAAGRPLRAQPRRRPA